MAGLVSCGPKHQRTSLQSSSPHTEVAVTFSFGTADGSATSNVRALVDPWELEVGQGWNCEFATSRLPYQFVAVVARAEGPHLAVGAVLVRNGQKVASFGGSLLIDEPGNNMIQTMFPLKPSISFEVMTEEEASQLRAEVKKKDLDFLECSKQDHVPRRE